MVRQAGLPEPTFRCKNRFYRQLVRAMSPLKTIETTASVGRSGKTRRLEFPQFQPSKDKGVITKPNRAKLLDDDFPAKYLEPPDLIARIPDMPIEERQSLPQWLCYLMPFLSACSIPIVFPKIDTELQPTFLCGFNKDFVKPIADHLGIPIMPLKNDPDKKKLVKYDKQHRWPILTVVQIEPEISQATTSRVLGH